MTHSVLFFYMQRVDELTKHSAILLEEKSSNATSSALDAISEALSISSRSEKLLEMKAEALYMVCALSTYDSTWFLFPFSRRFSLFVELFFSFEHFIYMP